MNHPTRSEIHSREAIISQIGNLPEEFFLCRDLRHAWKIEGDYYLVDPPGARGTFVGRTLRCQRCESTRTEIDKVDSKRGRLVRVAVRYDYPEGYLVTGYPPGTSWQQAVSHIKYQAVREVAGLK